MGKISAGVPTQSAVPSVKMLLDNQKMAFENCQILSQNVTISGEYTSIFSSSVNSEVVRSLQNMDKFREETLQ